MRVAIVHYWLLGKRGGEAVVEGLLKLLPDSELFTLFYNPERVNEAIRARPVHTSFLNSGRRWYRSLLPLMPMALESFDLREYDLVISSESGPAKGVLTPSTTRHICYCHTPMRYLWELYPAYAREWAGARWKRALMAPLANYLRLWDYASAARVDDFVANSENVKRRIWKTYRRDSEVVYPPVDIKSFYWSPAHDYFLIVSELVPYKCIDSAVRVFTTNGRRLLIVGDGPEYRKLRRMAGSTVEFCGRVSAEQLRVLYAECRALLLPGEEDFGIAPVEALASGKPVIALSRGGVLETVPPEGGVLYPNAGDAELALALDEFESREASFAPERLRNWSRKFGPEAFASGMQRVLDRAPEASRAIVPAWPPTH
ncbi:MAG TPA: glycosyltransferase [Bryobacteraceae bacterium]|nr:glycosyltransferase [Bryobacteraceae bacterium]